MFRFMAVPALLSIMLAGCQASSASFEQIPPNTAPVAVCGSGDVMMQTTLWFSMDKPNGSRVSSIEWQQFFDNDVTPRFKDGSSVTDAQWQRMGESGKPVREHSKMLMLIHSPDRVTSDSINELRDIFKKRFEQPSVMRVDSLVCVSF